MAHFMALQSEPSKLKKLRVTVGILTFYKAQKKLIEETLKERHLEACAAVKTVDASQGKIAYVCTCMYCVFIDPNDTDMDAKVIC